MRIGPARVWRWGSLLAAVSVACAVPDRGLQPPGPGDPVRTVWVVGHEWHTGLVIRRSDLPEGVWPEHQHFDGAEFLEIGWGDREFYQATEPTLGLALRAAFGASPSVLHVVAFSDPVGAFFAGSEIVAIRLSPAGLAALGSFVAVAHARDETGRAIALGPGLYGWSRFYLGREPYGLPETCNTWTARALRAAGLPITPALALTKHGVLSQLSTSGHGP